MSVNKCPVIVYSVEVLNTDVIYT